MSLYMYIYSGVVMSNELMLRHEKVWKGLIDTLATYAILTKIRYYGDILFIFIFVVTKSNNSGRKQQQAAPDK